MPADAPCPTLPVGLYRHRDGGLYDVKDLAFDSTSGPGEGRWMVLYRSHATGRLDVCELGQFIEPQTWPDGVTRPRFVPATRETTLEPGEAHSLLEAEVGRRGEAIIRRARAELLAIDPHCDCVVLWATRTLLALALDERVILPSDADAALALVDGALVEDRCPACRGTGRPPRMELGSMLFGCCRACDGSGRAGERERREVRRRLFEVLRALRGGMGARQ